MSFIHNKLLKAKQFKTAQMWVNIDSSHEYKKTRTFAYPYFET